MRLALEIIGAVALAVTSVSWRISEYWRQVAEARRDEWCSDYAELSLEFEHQRHQLAATQKEVQMYQTSYEQNVNPHPATHIPMEQLTLGEDGVARDVETMWLHGVEPVAPPSETTHDPKINPTES